MSAGFTKGPWVSTGFDYEPEAGWFIREGTGGAQRKAVARAASSFRPTDEIEANAALIAAAPELYEALVKAAEKFREYERLHLAKVKNFKGQEFYENARLANNADAEAKAARNREMAEACEAALAKARGND